MESGKHVLVTLHRPSNPVLGIPSVLGPEDPGQDKCVDEPETLREILLALNDIAHEVPVIFPVHPRTRRRMGDGGEMVERGRGRMERGCRRGIQEETSYLGVPFDKPLVLRHLSWTLCPLCPWATGPRAWAKGPRATSTGPQGLRAQDKPQDKPCLTARPNTERPVTITRGTNQLVASSRRAIVQAARNVLNSQPGHGTLDRPDLWDGRAAERIVETLGKGGQ